MKVIKKFLVLVLGILMTIAGFCTTSAKAEGTVATETPRAVFSIDAGRKYFSKDQLEGIINKAYMKGYSDVQILLGNDGLRFLLDDMSVTVGTTTYASDDVKAAIVDGNDKYAKDVHANDITNAALTETEMNEILAFAKERNINIIPVINSPGHMDAILYAMQTLGIEHPQFSTSHRTVDLKNETAVAFTQALVGKYITYFGSKGASDTFNLGTDEYANDASAGGWQKLQTSGDYDKLIKYVNDLSAKVKAAGMKPMCFNDGIYYNSTDRYGTFDQDLIISYWTAGWWGYDVAKPQYFVNKGHQILNTNDGWYYVVGNETKNEHGNGYTYDSAVANIGRKNFNDVPGGRNIQTIGSMQCVWCDYPEEVYEEDKVFTLIDKFSKKHATHMRNVTVKEVNINLGESFTMTETPDDEAALSEKANIKHRDDLLPLVEVTDTITAGKYLIEQRGHVVQGNKDKFNESPKGLPMVSTDIHNESCLQYLWTLEVENGETFLKGNNNEYMNINGKNVAMFPDKKNVVFTKKDGGYSISRVVEGTKYYLNNFGGTNTKAAGWTGDDNTWKMMKASQGIEVTPKMVGRFSIKAGNVTYEVNVTHAEHQFGEWQTEIAARCETAGVKVRTCTCGAKDTAVIPALGHDWQPDFTVDREPTCTEAGSKSIHCTICDKTKDVTEIPAAGHQFGEWEVVTPTTCEKAGVEHRVCAACQHEETREIAALGHDWEKDFTVDQEPTCTEAGSKSIHCTICDKTKDVTEIPAAGHQFGEWEVVTPTTCEKAGVEHRVCAACQHEETREIAALGHDWEKDFTVDQEPTCTEAGSKSIHCTRCDKKKDVTEIPAAGHKFSAWKTVVEPSASIDGIVDGKAERECADCHTKETKVVPATSQTVLDYLLEKNAFSICVIKGQDTYHFPNMPETNFAIKSASPEGVIGLDAKVTAPAKDTDVSLVISVQLRDQEPVETTVKVKVIGKTEDKPVNTPKPTEKPNGTPKPTAAPTDKPADKRPATGETRSTMPWAMVLAAAAGAGLIIKRFH